MKKRTQEVTHKIMASIKAKNTKPELIFRKALWRRGIRYRIHIKVIGRPDIAIKKYKLAIFIDGDFWHGNNWKLRGLSSLEDEINNYSDFWKQKIIKNVKRDSEVREKLEFQGWYVLRFWQSDIESSLDECIAKTIAIINKKRHITTASTL